MPYLLPYPSITLARPPGRARYAVSASIKARERWRRNERTWPSAFFVRFSCLQRSFRRVTAYSAILLAPILLAGCSSYYGQLATGQLELLRQRQPVAALVDDPGTAPALRERLANAQEARRFASERLALPDNGSYRQYADLGRPYVVWNLFATPEFSVEPLTRCFPIAGCVAYQGYYRQGAARGQAAVLRRQGFDTHVAGVEAYSTLGWFDDPLLNTMLRRNDEQLAGLIFHELAHQRLYVRDDTTFNESYASFVERQGLREWRRQQGLPEHGQPAREAYREVVELLLDSRERLRALYAQPHDEAVMRRLKQAEFDRLRTAYRLLRERPGQPPLPGFERWFQQPLNNATLLPFGLYDRWVAAFSRLFEQSQGDWQEFHQRVESLAAMPLEQRNGRLQELLDSDLQGEIP
ncbi:aminopeptidase [Stutzerimonas kirkiae]|uniref:Aminopeptidase n=1 Tax=Stutzerimonas kirkiae TaxID=2211392 RepID=A0A4Q9R7K2_9GAMM|nr:aminopeptidase [Stutzerimonas kirkiae]TBV02164.1 aminopeptidase [Stutzerimonas kirkiae]TBV08833.1 aminopeptidase [Stutzerimonas kirkiae]TBV15669.1 aminopeptidase [Stutzerimonas kirkiae]